RRNEIQISLPSMNLAFSMVYLRLCPGGPAKPARRQFAAARTNSEQKAHPFVKKMSIFEKSRPRGCCRPAERSASEPAEPRAGAEGKTLRQSAFRTQGRVDASQALERIRQAATLRRQSPEVGAVCGNPARTVLCGGRSAMSVPTAFYSTESGLFNGLQRKKNKKIWLPSQTLREMSQAVSTFLLGPPLARRGF